MINLKEKIYNNVFIFFIFITLLYTFEQIALGPFSYLYSNDTAMHAFPKRVSAINDLFDFGLSYWSPYVGGGADLYASSNLYYSSIRESSLLMLFFPPWLAYQITLFVSILLAGYFTFTILYNNFKLSFLQSISGGILYQAAVPYFFDIAISFLPMTLFIFQKYINKKLSITNIFIIIITSIFYCMLTGLANQFSCFALIILWLLLFNNLKKNWKNIFIYSGILISIFFSYFITLILALKINSISSHRTVNIDLSNICENVLTCIPIEDFLYSAVFNNIIPWGLFYVLIIFVALYNFKNNNNLFRLTLLLISFSIGTVLLSTLFKLLVPKIELLNFLKGFNTYRWGEPFSFLFVLSLLLTFNEIKKYKNKYFNILFISIVLLFFSYDQLYKKFKNIEIYLSRSHSYVSIFQNDHLNKLSKEQKPFRGQNYPGEITSISWLAAYNIEEAGGFSFMISSDYLDLWRTMVHGNYSKYLKFKKDYAFPSGEFMNFENITNNDFFKFRSLEEPIKLDEKHNMNLLSLFNIKYIYSRAFLSSKNFNTIHEIPKYLTKPGFNLKKLKTKIKLIFGINNDLFNIYENKNVIPRFYLTNKIKCFNDKKTLLDDMAESNLSTLQSTAFINDCDKNNYQLSNSNINQSDLDLIHYKPDNIKLDLNLSGETILIVTNSYNESWQALSNNGKKEIFKVNHAFWGIKLDKNDNFIEFIYKPKYMKSNLMIR